MKWPRCAANADRCLLFSMALVAVLMTDLPAAADTTGRLHTEIQQLDTDVLQSLHAQINRLELQLKQSYYRYMERRVNVAGKPKQVTAMQ